MKIKLVVLWLSACMLILGVGWFATRTSAATPADRSHAALITPAGTPAGDHATQSPAPAEGCQTAQPADVLSLSGDHVVGQSEQPRATCGANESFTCCRCGGCGCRPRNISPTNWCAC